MEDSSQSREHGVSLLVQSRKITLDAAKSGDPSRTAKGARNLLLNFYQAKGVHRPLYRALLYWKVVGLTLLPGGTNAYLDARTILPAHDWWGRAPCRQS